MEKFEEGKRGQKVRKKKNWKCLMALALSMTMLVPAQAAYAIEGGKQWNLGWKHMQRAGQWIQMGLRLKTGTEEVYWDSCGSCNPRRG